MSLFFFAIRVIFIAVCLISSFSISSANEIIDEVIVTADFLERKNSDLPKSISIIDQNEIKKIATQHFQELIYTIPNLNWSGDGNRPRYFQIRGVGELEQYEGAPNPSVGFLIDDIDFSGIGAVATLFDINQIEVLRGPQSGRYGANAIAGLIYMNSANPTDEFTGKLNLRVGQDGELAGGIAISDTYPGLDNLRYRASIHHHESNGFRKNSYLGRSNTNHRKETTLRGKLDWENSKDLFFRLSAMYIDINDGYDAFAIDNSFTTLSDKPGKDAQQSIGTSLKINWERNELFTLHAITSLAKSDMQFSFDADWGNQNAWSPYTYDYVTINERKRITFSQEFRFISTENARFFNDKGKWLLGIYILNLEEELSTINLGVYKDPIYLYESALNTTFNSKYQALNTALFSQLIFDVHSSAELTVGLRLENRKISYTDSLDFNFNPQEPMIGGEINYAIDLSENFNGYFSLAKGYKAGGFNLGIVPSGSREFHQEKNWNLETGFKSLWNNGVLAVNGSVFYNLRHDQQVRTSFQQVPNDPASFVFFTDNAAETESYGMEANMRWFPSEPLELNASAGLLKAKFKEFTILGNDLNGRDLAHAPSYSIGFGGIYNFNNGMFSRINISTRNDFYFDVSHNKKSMPFKLINIGFGYETEKWSLQFWVRNLLDERFAVRGFYFGNEPPDFNNSLYTRQGDPRQFGLTFDMRL